MTRTASLLLVVALSVMAGCGGGSASSRRSTSAPESSERATSARPRRLVDILGRLGVHQSPAELAEIAAFIRRFELDPWGAVPENPEPAEISTPTMLMMWLSESPDVTVYLAGVLSELTEGRGADVGPAATLGTTLGMAAYLIEHPGGDPESPEVQAAGIESALRWYEATLRSGGGRNEVMDELLEVRDHGSLVAWWSAHVTM